MNRDYLSHHGVIGMKWGVRRSPAQLLRARGRGKKNQEPEHDDYKKAHDKKSVRSMSNQELRDRNNRLQAERQYKDLTKKTGVGKKAVKAYVATAGTITAVAGATATYKKIGDAVLKNMAKRKAAKAAKVVVEYTPTLKG